MTGIEPWLFHYGIFAIFLLLALGIIGLPVPDETIIVLAGVLVSKGKLPLFPTLLAVYGGALFGISLSYILGYTCGNYLIERFGYIMRLTPKKIDNAKKWFKNIGKWVLFFGYFIIGLRHLAGLIAGMMKLSYKQFALFAYAGMFVWATTLFLIGYNFKHSWKHQLSLISYIGIIGALLALIGIYSYFFYQQRKT